MANFRIRSLDRFRRIQDTTPFHLDAVTEKSDNQLVFAFWTCLQLERFVDCRDCKVAWMRLTSAK